MSATFSERSTRDLETREDFPDERYQIVSQCSDRYSRYVNKHPSSKRYTLTLGYSVARCIRRTPSDAEKNHRKESAGCNPGAHSRGAGAVRCVDYTRGRLA